MEENPELLQDVPLKLSLIHIYGGATLALAETVAGLGSMIICESDEIVVGMQVRGNHISSAHEGDTEIGRAHV